MKTAIVDDDPIVCQSLATILSATGAAEVLWTANNGTDAVERYCFGLFFWLVVLLFVF